MFVEVASKPTTQLTRLISERGDDFEDPLAKFVANRGGPIDDV